VPNGEGKNVSRFIACVATYRARFRSWPTHARLGPFFLWEIAHNLQPEQFEAIAQRLELRTTMSGRDIAISVGGPEGIQEYEGIDYDRLPIDATEEAARWLGIEGW
jgi:hypothetical protein